jgi:two-component system chemotaxis response regulator CheB
MKVLLIEDSPTIRAYIEGVLRAAPFIERLPSAADGSTGVHLAVTMEPDVILMDLELPVLDGLQAIREIMSIAPRPIVVLSAHIDGKADDRTFESFQAGAVEVLSKPRGLGGAAVASFADRLLRTVRVMAEARVVRRRSSRPTPDPAAWSVPLGASAVSPGAIDIVVIGGSTGGPLVLYDLLQQIPKLMSVPIVVAQHIVPGFENGFAQWLGRTGHRVTVARAGESIRPGVVYVAPADKHLLVRRTWFELLDGKEGTSMPSVDLLFETTAESFGARSVALLLSGMGSDGARGMLSLRRRGAITATQTGESCVVDGMPAAARALSAASCELSPRKMAELLTRLLPAR